MKDLLLKCDVFMTNTAGIRVTKTSSNHLFSAIHAAQHAHKSLGGCTVERESGINVVEKQRLRDAITEQVKQFLDQGGDITVIEAPLPPRSRYRSINWHGYGDHLLLPDLG
jgi:methionine synthase I (cobalamin-dependent)